MKCPSCGKGPIRVTITRHPNEDVIVRYRRCEGCGHKFFSMEASLPADAVSWNGRDLTLLEEFRHPSWY